MRAFSSALLALLLVACSAVKPARVRHTVEVDGHPIAVWEKSAADAAEAILLVHGRTWSALPDFDLQVEGEDLSLMDGLVDAGYAVFAVDLRGYGETPRDQTGWLTPNRAADDVAAVVRWIAQREAWRCRPHLFGWSMGSTLCQLAVQRSPGDAGSLTLFGYWYDVDQQLPVTPASGTPPRAPNTAENAASDFVTAGAISDRAIAAYVAAALQADPFRVDLGAHQQFNALDASKLDLPVLVVVGEHDPVAPPALHAKLHQRIASENKRYVVVPGGDHAAFLETPRAVFLEELVSFLRRAAGR